MADFEVLGLLRKKGSNAQQTHGRDQPSRADPRRHVQRRGVLALLGKRSGEVGGDDRVVWPSLMCERAR